MNVVKGVSGLLAADAGREEFTEGMWLLVFVFNGEQAALIEVGGGCVALGAALAPGVRGAQGGCAS